MITKTYFFHPPFFASVNTFVSVEKKCSTFARSYFSCSNYFSRRRQKEKARSAQGSKSGTDGRTVRYIFSPSPVLIFPTFSKKSTRISLLFVREIDALSRAKQNIQLHRRRKNTPKTGLKCITAPSANRGTTQNKEENLAI